MKIKVLGKNSFVARNILFSNEVKFFDKKYLHEIDKLKKLKIPKWDVLIYFFAYYGEDKIISEQVNYKYFKKIYDLNLSKKYVYISTLDTLNKNVNSIYKINKLKSEIFSSKFENIKVVRLSYPFGLGQSEDRLVPKIIKKLNQNSEIVINDFLIRLTPINYITENEVLNENFKYHNLTPSNSELFSKIVNKLKKNLYSKSKILINNSDLTDHFSDIHHSLGIVDSKIYLSDLSKQMYIHS